MGPIKKLEEDLKQRLAVNQQRKKFKTQTPVELPNKFISSVPVFGALSSFK
jgi:hypothetical protein